MSQLQVTGKKLLSAPTIISTFVGMVMAVPMTIGISSLVNNAGAVPGDQASSQVSTADFAKFAYAYNQGYQASATSTSGGAAACVDVTNPGSGAGAASAAALSSPSQAGAEASVSLGGGSGSGGMWSAPVKSVAAKPSYVAPKSSSSHMDEMVAKMVNSYNSYTSMVYNSSSVAYTNSNNVVGSNNSNSTKVEIEDSHNVALGVETHQSAMQNLASESFNEDSYNTETNTLINNDSFNKESNVAINSGNTVTENTAVNHVEDAYNSETDVDMDTETNTNTTTTTNTDNSVVNNTENSHNTSSIAVEDSEIEMES